MKEETALLILEQILLTIDFMHLRGLIVREIKPETIIINNSYPEREEFDILFADLSSVMFLPSSNQKDCYGSIVCQSPRFLEPE